MKKQLYKWACPNFFYRIALIMFVGLISITGNAQTTLFSYTAENDNIGSLPSGWEWFGTSSAATVQFDSATTNKIIRINAGATTPSAYSTVRLQKTLAASYGTVQLSYKIRFNRLANAINTTNAPNFNRFGLNGTAASFNADNNTANATTSVAALALQGNFRPTAGGSFAPAGNFTLANNVWYQVSLTISRSGTNQVSVAGTIGLVSNNTIAKTITGTINTTTPTKLLNQFSFDVQAIYHYNTLDLDDIQLQLPSTVPAASNVTIVGNVEGLQTLVGSYALAGADTAGTQLQWASSNSANGPFVPIPGATSAQYQVARGDVGKFLSFTVYPASANGLITGVPVTAITNTAVVPHKGQPYITKLLPKGAVAVGSTLQIDYTYEHPKGIAEKNTQYVVLASDSFNIGYYKTVLTGTTNATNGINVVLDSSLVGKYLQVELLPQDVEGNYGAYAEWKSQVGVLNTIAISNVQFLSNGFPIDKYQGLIAGNVQVQATVSNFHPVNSQAAQLLVQLYNGKGTLVATQTSGIVNVANQSTQTIAAPSVEVSALVDGHSLTVTLVDAANKPLAAPERIGVLDDGDAVYQYYVDDGDSTRGTYLWIPPNTPFIRGIIIGIKNNAETQIMESADVRKVAEKWGLAEISIVMSGKTYNSTLISGLSFDFTNPTNANKFDSIIQALAIKSNHPELINAPFIPMAHSAYMDFPFHVAMRDNSKCIAAIPIKSGVPNIYTYYKGAGNGGSSFAPAPTANMNNVPLLFYQGLLPETIDNLFKTNPMRPLTQSLSSGFTNAYRSGDDGSGSYKPQNEYGGAIIDLAEGHFNALPRAVAIIANFIDKACAYRLPDTLPAKVSDKPALKPLNFSKGWLVDQNYFNNKQAGKYFAPAPYNEYKGNKKTALWYLDEALAKTCEQLAVTEYNKKVEQFTIYKPDGTPDTLFESVMSKQIATGPQYTDSLGIMRLKIFSFDKPWPIDTVLFDKNNVLTGPPSYSTNVLLPGVTQLPITNLPVKTKTSASCYQHIGNLEYKLRFYRYNPNAGGYTQSYVALYREGNDTVAASVRNVRIDRTQSTIPGLQAQTISFPDVPPIAASTRYVLLQAKASSGMPVAYFVRSGPAIVVNNQLIITQIPEGSKFPIPISVAAYQVGRTGVGGVYAAPTVYKTVWIHNIAPNKPQNLQANVLTNTALPRIALNWQPVVDSLVYAYEIWRDGIKISTVSNTAYIDSSVALNSQYLYHVTALNTKGNYSDSSNQVAVVVPNILPISISLFKAQPLATGSVACSWQVASTIGIEQLLLERSADGITYESIYSVSHVANSKQLYEDSLTNVLSGSVYYRLRIVEQNGKQYYSQVVKVALPNTYLGMRPMVNPFGQQLALAVRTVANGTINIHLLNNRGAECYNKQVYLTKGKHTVMCNTAHLAKGSYWLVVQSAYQRITQQVVKE